MVEPLQLIVYRSRSVWPLDTPAVARMLEGARARNAAAGITGLLVSDGDYFLQVLEGPRQEVERLYARIRDDRRHRHVVTILHESIDRRSFEGWTLGLVRVLPDGRAMLRGPDGAREDTQPLSSPGSTAALAVRWGERVSQVINAFMQGRWRDPDDLLVGTIRSTSRGEAEAGFDRGACQSPDIMRAACGGNISPVAVSDGFRFAFQPIVEPATRRVTSVEALLRGPNGEAPAVCLAGVPMQQRHVLDLQSKAVAVRSAAALKLGAPLSMNLLPMSLVHVPDAVPRLVDTMRAHGLDPQSVIVEITEEEMITQPAQFLEAVGRLQQAGVRVAIDDFGAGHAGLSLLAEFQPYKLKIDRALVREVHQHGPRQAIVSAIVDCCERLGVVVVAEGVESLSEYRWLSAVGVRRFQGYLFARPALDALPEIVWPDAWPAVARCAESTPVARSRRPSATRGVWPHPLSRLG